MDCAESGCASVGFEHGARAESVCVVFFFQAEDGIRDLTVTGVQTCALPICPIRPPRPVPGRLGGNPRRLANGRELTMDRPPFAMSPNYLAVVQGIRELHRLKIGRASCRERV